MTPSCSTPTLARRSPGGVVSFLLSARGAKGGGANAIVA
jgi:hypothetical protein